ncbi:hypothetical protein Pcinc_027874 [Petrolisthes cinctipes]|uniref:Uncharacterized protein n=1 Tax=Petrolisthes cinctipes TaxID=88211 RepID=A0AAE1F3J7_PETCI|nr:hypothetical protein Pcinc_027874 [Petrolisthes cinctipes]
MFGARRDEDPTSDCDHRETVPVSAMRTVRCVLPTTSSITTTNQPTNQPDRPTVASQSQVRSQSPRPTDTPDRPTGQISQSKAHPELCCCWPALSLSVSLAKTSSRAGNVWKKLHSAPPGVRQEDQTKPRGTSVSALR